MALKAIAGRFFSLSAITALCAVGCSGSTPVAPSTEAASAICEDPGLLPSPYEFSDLPCPAAEDLAAIRRDIPIRFLDEPGSPFVCNGSDGAAPLTYYQERIYSSVALLRRVRFDAVLPWTGSTLYDWFKNAIAGIIVERVDASYCCDPSRVIHISYGPTPQLWQRSIVTLVHSGLVHEARHADTGVFHTCPTSQRKDARVSDLGAYGVEYLTLLYMADHTQEPAQEREWYRYFARTLRLNSFCLECANSRMIQASDKGPTTLMMPPWQSTTLGLFLSSGPPSPRTVSRNVGACSAQ